jgi:hypothetical protein
MESTIRALIVPLSERLIKQLADFARQPQGQRPDLFTLELLVAKLLAQFAVALIAGLIPLRYGRGVTAGVVCAGCGTEMRLLGYARRQVVSCWGAFSYERAFYYCRACRRRRTPLDERLGVGARTLSPRLQRVLAYLAAHLSFGTVERALAEAYDVAVSAETVRQVAEGVGAEAKSWEDGERQRAGGPAPAAPARRGGARTWVIECDGKQVGFQDGHWQEVKIGVIYELGARVETRTGRHELLKRELVARRCGWEEFAAYFWAAMQRAGVREGDRVVAVADGAHAMEQVFAFVAPEATRVRDFYHVAERVHAIGELRFGAETAAARDWARAQLHKLKESEAAAVIRSIAHLKLGTRQAEETRRQVLGYLQNHRAAMDYARYSRAGLPIGSGAVEGGCRLIGARTNGCGRRWGEAGLDQIVALRVAVLNERLDLIRPRPQVEVGLAA